MAKVRSLQTIVPSHSSHPSTRKQTDIEKALELIAQAEQLLSGHLRTLGSTSRRRIVKMRRGGEEFTLSLARLIAASPMLRALHFDPSHLEEPIAKTHELSTLAIRLRTLTQALEDTLLVERGDAWAKALEVYKVSQGLAGRDANLAEELRLIEQYWKKARPKTGNDPNPVT